MKTSEARGEVLNYLVAKAMGKTVYQSKSKRLMTANYGEFNHRHGAPWFAPSTNWGQGGPIIKQEGISLNRVTDALWEATIMGKWKEDGPTPLIAAMRCYVGSRLGNEVEIPEELAEVTA
jgi:hypothetical protein